MRRLVDVLARRRFGRRALPKIDETAWRSCIETRLFRMPGQPRKSGDDETSLFSTVKKEPLAEPGREAGWSTSKGRQRSSRRALRPPAGRPEWASSGPMLGRLPSGITARNAFGSSAPALLQLFKPLSGATCRGVPPRRPPSRTSPPIHRSHSPLPGSSAPSTAHRPRC